MIKAGFYGGAWDKAALTFHVAGVDCNTDGGTEPCEQMRITGDGNVGIGVEDPAEKLEVDGNINIHDHRIMNLADPVNDKDAATKAYVDAKPNYTLTDNSIGSQHIINGTIKNEDISATANIDINKILGTSGVAFSFPTTFKGWSNGTYQIQTLTTITMDIPKDGYVLLIHTGTVVFFSFQRTMEVGIGTSSTEMLNGVRVGTLDGSSANRYEEAYSTAYVVQVAAGKHTFYALAEGNSVFKTGGVNVSPSSFIGVFIPNKY